MKPKFNEARLISKAKAKRTPDSSRAIGLAMMAASIWLAAPSVEAANYTWSAVGSGTAFWATGSNWSPTAGALGPGASDTAYFSTANGNVVVRSKGASVGGIVVNNTGTTSIAGGLTVSDGNGDFTIGSGGITINAGAGAVSIGYNLANHYIENLKLGASQSWINNSSSLLSRVGNNASRVKIVLGANALTIGGSGNTTLYHSLEGTGGSLSKIGAGTLTISGALGTAATYTGATSVSAGTLLLTATANINSTSGLSVASGATFTNNSNIAFSKGISLTEGAVLNGSGAFTPTSLSITADLTDGLTAFNLGSASLTKSGNFTLTLSGITEGTYSVFSGGSLAGSFGTMFIGATELSSTGSGNFSGVIGELQYTFTNATNQLVIASTIPEPSAFLLLGASAGAFAVLRRRRRLSMH